MFTRLFQSILESSVWCEDSDTKVVWITLLAMADMKGCVFAAVPGLSKRAGVPLAKTREALELFQRPDPDSQDLERCPENEGRRIERISGGWRILNHEFYQKLASAEDRRLKANARVQKHRDGVKAAASGSVSSPSESVSSPAKSVSSGQKSVSVKRAYNIATTEAATEAEAEATGGDTAHALARVPPLSGKECGNEVHPAALVAAFRTAVYPGKEFPLHVPSAEMSAASRLLAAHPIGKLLKLFEFVGADRPRAGWRGWRAIACTLTSFENVLPKLEAQALGGVDEPLSPAAAVVRTELDVQLVTLDPGLAMGDPSAAERLALNELVAKHGRDRVRICVRMAFEDAHWSKRIRDVDTLIGNMPALLSHTAEAWKAIKDDPTLVLDQIPEDEPA